MKLFKKAEPDMKCWNCDQLINHKKVNWKPRKIGAPHENPLVSAILTRQFRDIEKNLGNKDAIADPNHIFGLYEYEYRGQCPNCKAEQCGFWFGEESFNKIKGVKIAPKEKPFFCNECEKEINRGIQVWYSIRIQQGDEVKEYLVTLCPYCKTEQGYPFKYDLEYGIIE